MEMEKCKIGMKVKFTNDERHEQFPIFYPEVGTIGTIIEISENLCHVEWAEKSVRRRLDGSYSWYVEAESIEPVKSNTVWEMLVPKMTKNQFIHSGEEISEEVKKMVELAYTCGYRRAKKGKPFMYAKKGGNQ